MEEKRLAWSWLNRPAYFKYLVCCSLYCILFYMYSIIDIHPIYKSFVDLSLQTPMISVHLLNQQAAGLSLLIKMFLVITVFKRSGCWLQQFNDVTVWFSQFNDVLLCLVTESACQTDVQVKSVNKPINLLLM